MSNIDKRSLEEKAFGGLLDTAAEGINDWCSNAIRKGVPKAMDWIANKSREIISTLSDLKKPEDRIKKAIQEAVTLGLEHKEWAMVEAMKKIEISEEQIQQVLKQVEEISFTV